ncbi:LysR family transcriptional regulator [Paraburkholderia caballeronis]|uniref:LysR family transcriptional regulator n=1 Tax=Paraburkholderia caballeronis TaxID=416943 RepID=UPI0010658C1E|nr:LysR family transcriptional regulator [Paraburkholderia caballeronis]TDV26688.1 LysR family transcriptional regulator [Paraburkholderia caballeronis]
MDYYSAVRAFLHAAELKSFSKAAQQLDVKTSTVSRYINELESDLGIALFNRSTRGLKLTEGGTVFREHASAAIAALDDARDAASSLNRSPQGLLRVTMPTSFARRHVIPHLPAFLDAHPGISVDAVITDEVLNLIDSGIDLAIRIGALADSQLMARQLAPHRRIVCASPEYLTRHGTPSKPEDLADHAALCFPIASGDRWLLVQPAAKGRAPKEVQVRLSGRVRADNTDALVELAIAGCGIALLPTWSVGGPLRDGRLARVLPRWEAQPGSGNPAVWAVYARKRTVSSKVRAFIDFYADLYREHGDWGA